jgi:hypothetical protein
VLGKGKLIKSDQLGRTLLKPGGAAHAMTAAFRRFRLVQLIQIDQNSARISETMSAWVEESQKNNPQKQHLLL